MLTPLPHKSQTSGNDCTTDAFRQNPLHRLLCLLCLVGTRTTPPHIGVLGTFLLQPDKGLLGTLGANFDGHAWET